MFRVRFLPKTSYVSVVETRVFCWVQFFLRWIFRFQQMSGILWGFLWTSDYKLWTIIVPWIRPAIRVFYLKEGGVVSGGILKFPWSFFSPGWCAIWRVDPTHQEGGRTDFFLHIFSFWVTHIPTTPPKKTNKHGSPWKMMSKFCISFPRVPTLRKPNPLVFSGSFFGCKPVKLILPCCCQTRWPIFFGGVVSWVAGFRAFRDFYIEVMMIWRIGGQNQKPTNFIKQPADIALMYNGFCLYLRL